MHPLVCTGLCSRPGLLGVGSCPCVSPPPPGRLASEQGVEAGGGGVGGTQGSVEGALGYLAVRTHRISRGAGQACTGGVPNPGCDKEGQECPDKVMSGVEEVLMLLAPPCFPVNA